MQRRMFDLHDYMKAATSKLQRVATDIDTLKFVMDNLKELRERDSGIEHEIHPILDTYALLEEYLPDGTVDQVLCLAVGRARVGLRA